MHTFVTQCIHQLISMGSISSIHSFEQTWSPHVLKLIRVSILWTKWRIQCRQYTAIK